MNIPPLDYGHLLQISDAVSKCFGTILAETPVNPGRTILAMVRLRDDYQKELDASYPKPVDREETPEEMAKRALSPHAFAIRLVEGALTHFASKKMDQSKQQHGEEGGA